MQHSAWDVQLVKHQPQQMAPLLMMNTQVFWGLSRHPMRTRQVPTKMIALRTLSSCSRVSTWYRYTSLTLAGTNTYCCVRPAAVVNPL